MKSILLSLCLSFGALLNVWADTLQPSTTLPSMGKPEHLYSLKNGNNWYMNSYTSPTKDEEKSALFAFYSVAGKNNTYYLYNYSAGKWVGYSKASSYSNKESFAVLSTTRSDGAYWAVTTLSNDAVQFQPYNTSGVESRYMNFYGGTSNYPFDGTKTVGLWQQNGNEDAGSLWTLSEVNITSYTYTIKCDNGQSVFIKGKNYTNGESVTVIGDLNKNTITATAPEGKFSIVDVDKDLMMVVVTTFPLPTQPTTATYAKPQVYPLQQDEVGDAHINVSDSVYTLYNNVLAASFVKINNKLYFAGSEAMNLNAGSEPFSVSFGKGEQIFASQMTLNKLEVLQLKANPSAVGGAEHYDGVALVADYHYTYNGASVNIEWSAVLRDGSHYLRSEMQLTADGDVDMYNVIPMAYNVDTRKAGSTPAVVGNTRGAVIMSNKIFAGLENPVAYNTVGDATGNEDKYDLTSTLPQKSLTSASWSQTAQKDVPSRVFEVSKYGYPNIYDYKVAGVSLKANQKVETTITYTSGSHRLNLVGVDLVDDNGSVVASDYHSGYSGTAASNNVYSFVVPYDGTYTVRSMVENGTESIDASSKINMKIYSPKPGVTINTDIVAIQGRWSRNTTLADKETWKISAVVGLVAQDGQQANSTISKTQKRRSFLAYSERERAVPWRCMPAYISWYELNINRNNSADPTKNMNAEQVNNVLQQWRTKFYDRFGVAPRCFVIDDGWDNYGTWTFHNGFPNEMRDMATLAKGMNAGVGAWLGPVGGYGVSGDYRRNYWKNKGQQMVLSNPEYYKVFLDAAKNLTQKQGDFTFFKFDGISAQFSAVGPDDGDSGNENAEGIIRLERYVRENLKSDIFFNTTVGTWASPFWYHYTDATWRQENDYGVLGDNKSDRERWITYRDKLVHQNYVVNSPICPINTLMTHGFILSQYGSVSTDMSYDACLREMRCAFACGSGMVELYNDYYLMDTINGGQLWADLADCINWQKRNADVLMDAHWVGGDPWNGSKASIYGWAAWNGTKSVLTLRNGANNAQTITLTLREAFEIPANVSGSIILHKAFADQATLSGLTEAQAIDIDQTLTLFLPGSTVFVFDGIDAQATQVPVTSIEFSKVPENVSVGKNVALVAQITPADATNQNLSWHSSNEAVATVKGGFIKPLKAGSVTITAKALDGSGKENKITITIAPKIIEPYATNFDKESPAKVNNRKLNKVTLRVKGVDQTITLTSDKPYQMLSDGFTVDTGSELLPLLDWTGTWMHSYVYCDYNQNQQYDVTKSSDDELVSFTYYNGANSKGETKANSCGVTGLPSFVAPLQVGNYMLRIKIDWNNIDPAGNISADNNILNNGGCIIDIPLVVERPNGILSTEANKPSANQQYYDLQGRPVTYLQKGQVYLQGRKKLVVK